MATSRHEAPEPSTIRLNSKDKPDRAGEFYDVINGWKLSAPDVFRELSDALLDYVKENGHPPMFPVRLVAVNEGRKKAK